MQFSVNLKPAKLEATTKSELVSKIRNMNRSLRHKCWQDCVIDYALWQSAYARNLSTEEYLTLLNDMYAEDGSYVIKLRQILNKK